MTWVGITTATLKSSMCTFFSLQYLFWRLLFVKMHLFTDAAQHLELGVHGYHSLRSIIMWWHSCIQRCMVVGAKIFLVTSKNESRSCTTFAPRDAIDKALYSPELYLGGDKLGLHPEQLDITIAYHLLLEVSLISFSYLRLLSQFLLLFLLSSAFRFSIFFSSFSQLHTFVI